MVPTFEHDWLEAGVVTFELGRLLVMFLAEVFRVVNLDLTSARVFDRLDRRALSVGVERDRRKKIIRQSPS